MVPSDFAAIPGMLALAQSPSGPVVPGASVPGPTASGQSVLPPSAPTNANGGAGSPLNGLIWMLPVLLLVMIIMPALGNKKQKKQRDTMLAALKRHDRILTSAGIIGTVVEIRDHEVVLRTDEASDTRICFAKSAVQQVLREGKDSARTDVELKPKLEAANAR